MTNQVRSNEKVHELLTPTELRDYPLVVEGTKIFINRGTLATLSPFFNKCFYDKNFNDHKRDELNMPDEKLDEILAFLQCLLWIPEELEINMNNLQFLVKLADKYDTKPVESKCKVFVKDMLSGD